MIAPAVPAPAVTPAVFALQAAFLRLLPKVQLHAEFAFRHVRCEQARADYVAETVALAWRAYLALARRGRDAGAFATTLALRCAQAARAGRRLHRADSARDALSPVARRRHGFDVEQLPHSTAASHDDRLGAAGGQRRQDAFEERLRDNTQTPVPDQVQFRIDFPEWLATLAPRERRMARDMANGERTRDLSRRFDVSPARVSQLRRALRDDWRRFTGQAPAVA